MSTVSLGESPNTLSAYDTRLFSMDSRSIESLADFVRRVRKEKGLSTPDVERNSGNRITDGYVSQIENGYIKNVSPEKLHALAKGLGVSEEEIFAVARGKAQSDGLTLNEMRLLEYYRSFKPDIQADVLAMIEGIYKRRTNERAAKDFSTDDSTLLKVLKKPARTEGTSKPRQRRA